MSASHDQAMLRLRKWGATRAPILVSFVAHGLTLKQTGRIVLDEEKSMIWLVTGDDAHQRILASLSLHVATPIEELETVLDSAEDLLRKPPFISALAFKLPGGNLDLREISAEE